VNDPLQPQLNTVLFDVFARRCAEHGIRVQITDNPYDTFIVLFMRMLDYVEESRRGILLAKDGSAMPPSGHKLTG
jgi:hypothetical protein